MQNYIKLANTLALNKKNNGLQAFENQTRLNYFIGKLQSKTYYQTYIELYLLCKCVAFISQIASLTSSYSFVFSLLNIEVLNIKIAITILLLILIESIKFILLDKALFTVFGLENKPNYVLLVLSLVWCLFSVYCSVQGSTTFVTNTTPVLETKHNTEINIVRNEIKQIINRNTYNKKTWIVGKDKALLMQKELILSDLIKKKDNELENISNEIKVAKNGLKIGFCIFDLCFILCTWYTWVFIEKSTIENLANSPKSDESNTPILVKSNEINDVPINENNTNQIGFEYNTKIVNTKIVNPTCFHCGKEYVKNHAKQKYCTNNCKVQFWELKNNRKLHFKTI